MFNVKFISLVDVKVIAEREMPFIPYNPDKELVGDRLYSVFKTEIDTSNSVLNCVKAYVFPF